MDIQTLVVGDLQTNCYLVSEKEKAVIIDPGADADYIQNRVRDLNLTPLILIATHGHFDHLLAVNELKMAFGIPFCMRSQDTKLLSWYQKSSIHFTGFDPGPAPIVDSFEIDKVLKEQGIGLSVFFSPGHTPGGICIYSKKEKIIFTGDTLFSDGAIGRYDYPYADKNKLLNSVKKVNEKFKGYTAYPGHGESFVV